MIRRAVEGDAEAIARVFRLARTACLPYLPDLHSPDSELRFFRDHVMRRLDVWVAGAPAIDGFCAFGNGSLEHLYVRPDRHRQGIGSALLALAQQSAPSLQLWVFQRNTDAIPFYEGHGFRIVEATDGSRNEENEPDFRMQWRTVTGTQPNCHRPA
jgi:ribosomal protein S18 acetylase RimI-like enzyme